MALICFSNNAKKEMNNASETSEKSVGWANCTSDPSSAYYQPECFKTEDYVSRRLWAVLKVQTD